MSVLQTQFQITKRLGLIEDTQERLAAVVDRVRKLPPFSESERVESNRIQGCVSRVWIIAAIENERCRFKIDADSTLVRGLASLICEVYDEATPQEIATQKVDILAALHLIEHLSPTRRHGLEQVHRAIRDFAKRCL